MIRKAREMQSLLQFDGETPLDVKWIVFGRVRINVRSTREGGREGRGKRVGNWEMPQGAIAKLREWGVNHVTVVVCRMHEFDSNREPGNRIRGFHAFWIRPATPDSFPFTSPLITPTGHRHLTRYNCSLVPFNVEIEGREERKKRNVRLLSTNCDDELNFNESILFLFVHRISSFFAPFLPYLDLSRSFHYPRYR